MPLGSRPLPGAARQLGSMPSGAHQGSFRHRSQPSLFERFCAAASAPVSPRAQRETLRDLVLRDLGALFNSTNHEHLLDPTHFGPVLESCWNFGLRSISGTFDGPKAWEDIEQAIRAAIERFEPRILPGSVEVTALRQPDFARHNVLNFQIRGLIRDLPQALPFVARSSIDLETRRVWLGARENPAPREGASERS